MRLPRLYHAGPLAQGRELTLADDAFTHAIRVLRLKEQAPLILFNGDGRDYRCQIVRLARRTAWVRVEEERENHAEGPLEIHLGLGISKGSRMDQAIQKAIELGVTRITPLFCERSVVRLNPDSMARKREHWQGVAISACEQCGRAMVPAVKPPRALADWSGTAWEDRLKLLPDPLATMGLKALAPCNRIILLTGPEGGLGDGEKQDALAAGFTAVRLGGRVLRTETAPLAVIAALQTLWGDMG